MRCGEQLRWLCRTKVRANDGQVGAQLWSDGGDAQRGQAAAGAAGRPRHRRLRLLAQQAPQHGGPLHCSL